MTRERERQRLEFVEERDGSDAMLRFAEQTLAVYIDDSIRQGPHRESIAALIEVLEERGLRVAIVEVTGKAF